MKLKHIFILLIYIAITYTLISQLTYKQSINNDCYINSVDVEEVSNSDITSFIMRTSGTTITLSNGMVINTNENVMCQTSFGSMFMLANMSKEVLLSIIIYMYLCFIMFVFLQYELWKEYDKGIKRILITTFWLLIMPITISNAIIKEKLKE